METQLPAYEELIEKLLIPESKLESTIMANPDWREGALWGKPRWGHPEGATLYHIREVLENIDRLSVGDAIRSKLRLIALVHDSFKHQETKSFPGDMSNHHGVIARKFMSGLISDNDVLDVIQHHDEAFYAWRLSTVFESPVKGKIRLDKLISLMGDNLQLFYLFFKCDTLTGNKTPEPLFWFERKVSGIEIVTLD